MDRERLLDLALAALEEFVLAPKEVRTRKPVALRLVLAYLWHEGDRSKRTRHYIDRIWAHLKSESPTERTVQDACIVIYWSVGRERPAQSSHTSAVIGRDRDAGL